MPERYIWMYGVRNNTWMARHDKIASLVNVIHAIFYGEQIPLRHGMPCNHPVSSSRKNSQALLQYTLGVLFAGAGEIYVRLGQQSRTFDGFFQHQLQ